MKQVFIKKGDVLVTDVPSPTVNEDEILVRVCFSCISSGTELAGIAMSAKPLYKKAMEKPQNISKVINMIKEKGIKDTILKIKSKTDSKNPTGYSASGIVLEAGKNIIGFKPGDRVACTGAGIANHAEFIAVPQNLSVKIPESVSFEEASTVALGAIAMQGTRRAGLSLGENAVIIGLGIIGQLTQQMLKASGIKTIGIDLDNSRIKKSMETGLDHGINPDEINAVDEVNRRTNGIGADAVIITAASSGNSIINEAIEMCRKKGKVIIVGDVALNIKREELYKKEIDLLISTSYGPGRYDEKYERKGFEYPYPYIRWTENRNMEAYLELISQKKINTSTLIEATYLASDALKAYEDIKESRAHLIVLLEYSSEDYSDKKGIMDYSNRKYTEIADSKIKVGIIGAGNFTRETHLPDLEKLPDLFNVYAICDKDSGNADNIAKRYGAGYSTTDYNDVIRDENVNMVIISTRHNLHAEIAIKAAERGKAILVEKPMALNQTELDDLVNVLRETAVPFSVGFNRRFSLIIKKIHELVADRENPLIINYRMNAGYIPPDIWIQNEEGGGRNIGEACHIYDLFNYLTGASVTEVSSVSIDPKSKNILANDNFVTLLKYDDGSVCTLTYTANGNEMFPKEIMDIYYDGKIINMNDFKELNVFGLKNRNLKLPFQDKGHLNEIKSFGEFIRDKNKSDIGPIPFWQLIQATEISFAVEHQIKNS
jgi:predicted dehydrogenase/threonine dehydrogenase-like Zn-dependent dehydrogenase